MRSMSWRCAMTSRKREGREGRGGEGGGRIRGKAHRVVERCGISLLRGLEAGYVRLCRGLLLAESGLGEIAEPLLLAFEESLAAARPHIAEGLERTERIGKAARLRP